MAFLDFVVGSLDLILDFDALGNWLVAPSPFVFSAAYRARKCADSGEKSSGRTIDIVGGLLSASVSVAATTTIVAVVVISVAR